ncbi:hypothetical protein [Motilibacter aurantiacus]|uniref:hypothetical protein n=1 Tax=Motilibacter aurantiacus TaxID=2714955 RepID=UPI00140CB0D7|nr:hypothetical protein [Motilibacter aurantiacus]NHC44150.1 hypothetical protein [Motilibacter aurantiacus]
MHADDIDVTADGEHAYCATLGERTLRVTVDPRLLEELGLTTVQEPLLLRRVLDGLPAAELAGLSGTIGLTELAHRVPGFPDAVVARLRA